jgi:hypothetical protein
MVLIPNVNTDIPPLRRDTAWEGPPHYAIKKARFPRVSGSRISQHDDPVLPQRKKRGIFGLVKSAFAAPILGLFKLINKLYPSEDCIRCMKMWQWMLMSVSAVIAIVVAIAPFLT